MMPPLFAIPFPFAEPGSEIAFSVGPLVIRWYALAYIVGLLGGWWLARRLAARASLWGAQLRPTAAQLDDLLVWTALGVVLGGRLAYVMFYNPAYFLQNPLEILQIWRGGMAFHGGLAGAALAVHLFARRHGLSTLGLFDLCAVVAPIGLFLGRIANFINGELWGRAADVPWAVVFPGGGPVPRHPSQLYEAGAEGLLLFLVMLLAVRMYGFSRPGLLAGLFGLGYALARIACEFFREPDAQLGFLLGEWATMGMLLSMPLGLAGAALLARALRQPPLAGALAR
jgi:phosphatidylglycerol:prolipoprotein diacylglycerol transferase